MNDALVRLIIWAVSIAIAVIWARFVRMKRRSAQRAAAQRGTPPAAPRQASTPSQAQAPPPVTKGQLSMVDASAGASGRSSYGLPSLRAETDRLAAGERTSKAERTGPAPARPPAPVATALSFRKASMDDLLRRSQRKKR
jgi:hypothetical protein